jgi:hypothetical protein
MYKEIQMGSGEKSYMRKGFLIYEDMRKCTKKIFSSYMRRSLVIYDFGPDVSEFPNISFLSVCLHKFIAKI